MKATKVLGAVLGVLMVAALFTGAVAAANNTTYVDTTADSNITALLKDLNNTASIDAVKEAIENLQGADEATIAGIIDAINGGNLTLVDIKAAIAGLGGDATLQSIVDAIKGSTETKYAGDWYIYVLSAEELPTLTSIDGKVTISATPELVSGELKYAYIAGPEAAGTYYYYANGQKIVINVKYPSATLVGYVYKNGDENDVKSLIDGTVDLKDQFMINALPLIIGKDADGKDIKVEAKILFTNPADTLSATTIPGATLSTTEPKYYTDISGMDLGVWTAQSVFENTGYFSKFAPSQILGTEYQFTVIDAENSKKITASADEVKQGEYVTVTVEAPYGNWKISVDETAGEIPAGQVNVKEQGTDDTGAFAVLKVGTSGVGSLVIKSISTDDMKISLYTADGLNTLVKQITVKVTAGAITATTDKDKVYIGDEFDVDGTNDLGGKVYFYIKGTNYNVTPLKEGTGSTDFVTTSGKTWTKTLDTYKFADESQKKPDAGTYTIYIAQLADESALPTIVEKTSDFDNDEKVAAYTTVSVALVQPFITVEVADVVVQGDKLVISGSAEGNPAQVAIYVFGTNFFKAAKAAVLSDDATYSFSQKIVAAEDASASNWGMAAGQYFVVVQHPMYDRVFNVGATDKTLGADILKNNALGFSDPTAASITVPGSSYLFNTNEKQSANAAYALEIAIANEDIDDMQAHKSFIVKAPNSDVNAVPSQVTQGQKLVISGVTSGHQNEMVSVELLSTAFAATSKEAAGSAAFATLTTRIGADGKWSVTFDTTNMNCDDYTVSIAVGSLDPVTTKTKIVKADTPVTPTGDKTTTPTIKPTAQPTTTPKTPGFGALAALVGLGAVAVLLLRRE